MGVVRTAKLASGAGFNVAGFTLFTVPAQQTWLVKGVTVTNDSNAGAITAELYLVDGSGNRGALVHGSIPQNSSLQFNGIAVAGQGDSGAVTISGGQASWWISGSKLAGVA